jgi:hypothetical protein
MNAFEHLIGTAYAVDVVPASVVGTKKRGRCTCGWQGEERWMEDVALNDCLRHMKNVLLVRASESEPA